jgi:beta-fructofuranosidase
MTWEHAEPFWDPRRYITHECPDVFQWGDWWYLVYSTFSAQMVTHYRRSRRVGGPWTAPTNDTFDGRGYYAAKTASDGRRRFAFGWVPTRAGQRDDGRWQWGGHLVVHEIVQEADGALAVKPPAEVVRHFSRHVAPASAPRLGRWSTDGTLDADAIDHFAWCSLGAMPETCCLATTITFEPETRACGVVLRTDAGLDRGYQIRLEPGRNRFVFDRWPRPRDEPFMVERPVALPAGQPVRLQVIVDGSVIVAYVNDRVALSARGYDHMAGEWGTFVSEGRATFDDLGLFEPERGSSPTGGYRRRHPALGERKD